MATRCVRARCIRLRGYIVGELLGIPHAAHQAVYEATMAGRQRGVPLREALLAHPGVAEHLTADEIAACLDPREALGPAPAFVDRVVAGDGPETA